MADPLPRTCETDGVRHRFHSICPYFAMFPESFVQRELAASPHRGVVFDPFCGRGTTVFQALLDGRNAGGVDVNPVAVCVSGAKCDPPRRDDAQARLRELRNSYRGDQQLGPGQANADFFELCFDSGTLAQILYLRSTLDWRGRKEDRFLAALCLGALHGESHRTPNCFSNRMPRTISTKPGYSVRWWRRNGCLPPQRDAFEILERMIQFRFSTPPPIMTGTVLEADARRSAEVFPLLRSRVTDVITSPPYLDTTKYREDQWLRLWFLGSGPTITYHRFDDRHYSKELYWSFLEGAWRGLAPLLAPRARIVIRIGGRRLTKPEIRERLQRSLVNGFGRDVRPIGNGASSKVGNTQANAFRGPKASQLMEHDFLFAA